MIELIYNEDGKTIVEEKNLPEPKNVKKVGAPGPYKKIFIEESVHNFLYQYSMENDMENKVAVLVGCSERQGGKRNFYIRSAYPVPQVVEKYGKFQFAENVWGEVYRNCERYFPEQEILGWFLAERGRAVEKTAVIEETHRTYFSGSDKVFFMIEPSCRDCGFFAFDGNRFTKQEGYYICKEKNEQMRAFLNEKNGEKNKSQITEKPDVAIVNFRRILKEKQEKRMKRRKRALSYSMKIIIALIFFVGAVALKNQMDEIRRMEKEISSWSTEVLTETMSEQVVVEELPGNLNEMMEEVFVEPVLQEESAEVIEEEPVMEEIPEQVVEPVEEETPVYEEYQVCEGDTLAGIARSKYGSDDRIEEICTLNKIENGDYIQVGEIILLP